MSILVQSKSWSFSSASRQTRRNEAAERALPRNSRFLFKMLRGSSSSGVMERAEASSFYFRINISKAYKLIMVIKTCVRASLPGVALSPIVVH